MSEVAVPSSTRAADAPRESRLHWLANRLLASAPRAGPAFGGACVWSLIMAASAGSGLYSVGWQTVEKARLILAIYSCGAFVAFPLALWLARFIAKERSRETALAASFLALAGLTVGLTALFFGLYYRLYYAQWHAEPLTKIWVIQFIHTLAGAVYQFAVLGLRLYFPLGFAALLVASLLISRRAR